MDALTYASAENLRNRFEEAADRIAGPSASFDEAPEALKTEYAKVIDALAATDGTSASLVSLLTGMSRERLDELGGF